MASYIFFIFVEFLDRKPEGRGHFGRPRPIHDDNIKMNPTQIFVQWKDVNWIRLA
jgi:hypothetical protein